MNLLEAGIGKVTRAVTRSSSNLKSWPKYARGNWTPRVPKPPKLDHAGDINLALKSVDRSLPRPAIAQSKLISEADEITSRICSLEFAPAANSTEYIKEEARQKFERYPGDNQSLEVKIAKTTIFIRKYAEICNANTADKVAKVKLLHAIKSRHRLLAALRTENYDRFQYCLKELGIKWSPRPETPEEKRRPTKREMRLKEVVDKCEALKQARLAEVQIKFGKDLEKLRKEKDDILRDVAESMKRYGIREEDIFFNDGSVKPIDYEAQIAAEQQAKWNEAEKKNLVRWMRVIQRPVPKMSYLTCDLLRAIKITNAPAQIK